MQKKEQTKTESEFSIHLAGLLIHLHKHPAITLDDVIDGLEDPSISLSFQKAIFHNPVKGDAPALSMLLAAFNQKFQIR